MEDVIRRSIQQSISTKQGLSSHSGKIAQIINELLSAYKNNRKILICGNGGSAADSQHFAAELVGRFKKDRKALPAIALTTDTSIITAISNDYGFENVFSRQVVALGEKGDILIGISTSGNSKDIIRAVKEAKGIGMKTICLLGCKGGALNGMCDLGLVVDSDDTPRIQECHILIIHIICEMIERTLFGEK